MKVSRTPADIALSASACAIGMFDGVHSGHRMVLENALREARLHNAESVVLSFANHPQSLTSTTPTQLLSTLEERLEIFASLDFDHALILDFDEALKNMPALDFVSDILVARLGVRSVTVGYDHRFGAGRQGDGAFLAECGRKMSFDAQVIDPVRVPFPESGSQIVSSTVIRKLLAFGDLRQANELLGRPYQISGPVEPGLQRGRQLGYPTANLAIESNRLVPATGTYGGHAILRGQAYPAVCNIGLSPTFADQTQKRVEVHLLNYSGEPFYGEPVTMVLRQRIRDEIKFPSVEALVARIAKDCAQVARAWREEVESLEVSNREVEVIGRSGHRS